MDSLYRQCANMVMAGFTGHQPPAEFLALAREGLFGAILFARNIASAQQAAELCRELKATVRRPFLVAVDQEGGRVARFKGPPFTRLPPMREVGRRRDAALAERVGKLLAYEVSAVGCDWDFAPVLDVDTNPKNPVIGDRSFDADPARVAELGVALARGMEAAGVASCAKHFPGHGDTLQDSHLSLPRLPHSLDRLFEIELLPFSAYAQAKLSSMMTAHVVFEAIDKNHPATLSAPVLQGLLRGRLGFSGVLVSDDLEMKAIADSIDVAEAAVLGAAAGVDLFLVCHHLDVQHRAISALVQAVESGRLPKSRIEEANKRLDAFAARFYHSPGIEVSRLGSAEHQALAQGLSGAVAGLDPTEPKRA